MRRASISPERTTPGGAEGALRRAALAFELAIGRAGALDLCMASWGFASASVAPAGVFRAIAARAAELQRARDVAAADAAQLLWAAARALHPSQALIDVAAAAGAPKHPVDVANLATAYALLLYDDSGRVAHVTESARAGSCCLAGTDTDLSYGSFNTSAVNVLLYNCGSTRFVAPAY